MDTNESFTLKLIPPILGFIGNVIMLSYMRELPTRHWVSALLFGAVVSFFGPPFILAYLQHKGILWAISDEFVKLATAGMLGLFLGMSSIHLIGGLTVLGKKFSTDPTQFLNRK